ncbi:MAG TPA: AAA family ATPase, partial [Acidobacteriota bacterium]|nr:AAA family ATPase [Acidobacteriota bacterium]
MSQPTPSQNIQSPPAEQLYRDELRFLEHFGSGVRPPNWRLTPQAVVTFIVGSKGETLRLPKDSKAPDDVPRSLVISEKFVGNRALVERCVVTLAGERGLMLVGEPGTAKSMLSELLAAAICGTSGLTVQGTAGTTEEQLRYGWNYSLLIAKGPRPEALVPSPILTAMNTGGIGRVEEVTRCLPEIQDALISLLSERRLMIPELQTEAIEERTVFAQKGFNVIATANLRDRGVSEMSAALKRRFNFETIP